MTNLLVVPTVELNLPDEVKHLYQRRYSHPNTHSNQNSYTNAKSKRRFSLGALHQIEDVSSAAINGHLNRALRGNGFLDVEQARSEQYRRYSTHIDPNIVNLLNSSSRRGSFLDKRLAYNNQNSIVNGSSAEQSLSSNGHHHKDSLASTFHDEMSCLWGNRCRRDSLAKFRKRINEKLRSRMELNFQPSKKNAQESDESYKFPKCKYKLRENGMITSELASLGKASLSPDIVLKSPDFAFAVDYGSAKSKFNKYDIHKSGDDVKWSHSQGVKKRPFSSTHEKERSNTGLEFASSAPKSAPSKLKQPLLESNYQYTFYEPAKYHDPETQAKRHRTSFSVSESPLFTGRRRRSSAWGKHRYSITPDFGFQVIGDPALHGSPNYKGRLMILTSRTVHFNDE